MAVSSKGRGSRKTRSRGTGKDYTGGMIDILCDYDTRYPDLRPGRNIRGNGPTPGNPYGKEIKKPSVG